MKNSQHKVSPTRLSLIILGFISFGSFFVPVLLTHATTVAPACSDPAPTCTMTASPSTIVDGNSSTLSWTSANVTSVTINQGIGSVSANSSKNVSPSTTTTYTGTFTGPGGSTTCSGTITVNLPDPKCSMDFNPSSVEVGHSSILTWTSQNVTDVSINQGIGSVNLNGHLEIFRNSTATYTGTFKSPSGDITCQAILTVGGGGGGGDDQPRISLSSNRIVEETEPSFIYLSQVPYTGIPPFILNMLGFLFRFTFFGGLLFSFYKIK